MDQVWKSGNIFAYKYWSPQHRQKGAILKHQEKRKKKKTLTLNPSFSKGAAPSLFLWSSLSRRLGHRPFRFKKQKIERTRGGRKPPSPCSQRSVTPFFPFETLSPAPPHSPFPRPKPENWRSGVWSPLTLFRLQPNPSRPAFIFPKTHNWSSPISSHFQPTTQNHSPVWIFLSTRPSPSKPLHLLH